MNFSVISTSNPSSDGMDPDNEFEFRKKSNFRPVIKPNCVGTGPVSKFDWRYTEVDIFVITTLLSVEYHDLPQEWLGVQY